MATLEQIGEALKRADAAGNTDDARQLATMYRDMKSAQAPTDYRQQLDDSLSGGERFLIGMGRGATDVIEGVGQIGRQIGEWTGLTDDQSVERYTAERQKDRDLYDKGDLGFAGGAGRFAGNVAMTAIPGGAAGRAAQIAPGVEAALQGSRAARMMVNATAGAGAGATQFVGADQSRIENAAMGAVGGVIGGAVLESLGRRLAAIPRSISHKASYGKRLDAARESLRGQLPEDELNRVSTDIADGLTPEQAMRKNQLERLGAMPTRGQVTDNLDDLRFENTAKDSENALRTRYRDNRAAALNNLDDRVDAMSGGRDVSSPETVGDAARESLTNARRTAQAAVSQKYDDVAQQIDSLPPGTTVRTTDLATAASDDDVRHFLDTDELKPIGSFLRQAGINNGDDINPVDIPPQRTEAFRRMLGGLSRSPRPQTRYVARKLSDALESDTARDLGEDLYEPARSLSRDTVKVPFDSKKQVAALINGKLAPDDLIKRIGSASFKTQDVRDVLGQLDTSAPEVGQQVRAAFLSDVFGKLKTSGTDSAGVQYLSPATFVRRLNSIGDDKLKAMYGEDTTKDLHQIAKDAARLMGTDRELNTSPTADRLKLMSRLGSNVGKVVEKIPTANLALGLLRVAREGASDRKTERQIRKAINLEYLKREQTRDAIRGVPGAAPGSAAGVGSLAPIVVTGD